MSCWQNLPERFINNLKAIIPQEKLDSVLESFCSEKAVVIRINTLKTDKQTVQQALAKYGIATQNVNWYDAALLISDGLKSVLTQTDEYKKGFYFLQNLSGMIPALILDPKPFEKVLDLAAAPGSKTTQLAQMMHNTGEIVANDISKNRLYKLKAISKLLGVENVTVQQIPGEYIWKKYPNYFDRVLLDAPCSMEGRFNTNDPKSYKDWSAKKIKVLSYLQKRMLRSAFYAVRPGGIIVYATCTLALQENEEVINWLLDKEQKNLLIENIAYPGIPPKALINYYKPFPDEILKTYRILPDSELEGFFIAKLRRVN